MDYCRVDYKTNRYEYFENDFPILHYTETGEERTEYRSSELMKYNYNYQRIKHIKALPPGKEINVIYRKGQ